MTDLEIDNAVLAVVKASWSKVALIIVRAAQELGGDLPEGNVGHRKIARRIEALVREGRLQAQGEIRKWRHCEIRRP